MFQSSLKHLPECLERRRRGCQGQVESEHTLGSNSISNVSLGSKPGERFTQKHVPATVICYSASLPANPFLPPTTHVLSHVHLRSGAGQSQRWHVAFT